MFPKLFIPGPTHVRDEILQAQTAPMIGHRAPEYAALQKEVTPKLQQLLYTEQRVYLYASSSSGVMEASVRQASAKRVLNTICGAFSKRWHQMTVANGIPFLGFLVFPDHRRLRRDNGVFFERRLKRLLTRYAAGEISRDRPDASVRGWVAHAAHGDTWGLRGSVLGRHTIPAQRRTM